MIGLAVRRHKKSSEILPVQDRNHIHEENLTPKAVRHIALSPSRLDHQAACEEYIWFVFKYFYLARIH